VIKRNGGWLHRTAAFSIHYSMTSDYTSTAQLITFYPHHNLAVGACRLSAHRIRQAWPKFTIRHQKYSIFCHSLATC